MWWICIYHSDINSQILWRPVLSTPSFQTTSPEWRIATGTGWSGASSLIKSVPHPHWQLQKQWPGVQQPSHTRASQTRNKFNVLLLTNHLMRPRIRGHSLNRLRVLRERSVQAALRGLYLLHLLNLEFRGQQPRCTTRGKNQRRILVIRYLSHSWDRGITLGIWILNTQIVK